MSEALLIAGGDVFDGSGAPPARADVLVQNGLVTAVGLGIDTDFTGTRIDATGQTVTPGFIDCHVHVTVTTPDLWALQIRPFSLLFYEAAENLRRTLAAGFTTVRDAGGADHGMKRAVELGLISGPRLLLAITMLSQTGGHGDGCQLSGRDIPTFPSYPGVPGGVVDGPGNVRLKVRELVRAKADWIKVAATGGVMSGDDLNHRQFRDDELLEMVTEAAVAGLDVMAHAHSGAGIRAAILAGARSIEHGVFLDDETIALMVGHGTWLVPTLKAPRDVVELGAGTHLPAGALAKARALCEEHDDSVRRAHAAGVRIALGTDSGIGRHGDNLREVGLLAAAGLGPWEALRAATGGAAELLRLDTSIGFVRPGHVADLAVVSGDLTHLTEIEMRVSAVIQAGTVLSTAR